jgi:hypothetical protein
MFFGFEYWVSSADTNVGLQAAAAETEKITGGSLDYVIANAGLVTTFDAYASIGEL